MEKNKVIIPFNKPYCCPNPIKNIKTLFDKGLSLEGGGYFAKKCQRLLERKYNIKKVLLTTSCTSALEMAAILADIKQGDEVIMPSYTFVSTANSVVLRGAKPVFVDISIKDLNIDTNIIEKAITKRTKAIIVVHYCGISCNMDKINKIAKKYNLFVIEDAAQSVNSYYKNKAAGSFGNIGAISFHSTKNIQSGECGAIYINDERLISRAEILLEKGTNRKSFKEGIVDKYTWEDVGSSYYPNDLTAAFLYSQLKCADFVTRKRKNIWEKYHKFFEKYERKSILRRPIVSKNNNINAHFYYIILNSKKEREDLKFYLNNNGITAQTHFVPLHSSPFGKKVGKVFGNMDVTNKVYDCLLRLPIYCMKKKEISYVIDMLRQYYKGY